MSLKVKLTDLSSEERAAYNDQFANQVNDLVRAFVAHFESALPQELPESIKDRRNLLGACARDLSHVLDNEVQPKVIAALSGKLGLTKKQ